MSIVARARSWFRPPPEAVAARQLFAAVMAEARRPAFYLEGGVADSVDGRFDLVVAHLGLLLRRLKREGEAGQHLARLVLESAFANFDEALREMGVGDLTVPKKIKKMAQAFYGRARAYDEALDAGAAGPLEEALRRNLYRGAAVSAEALAWTRQELLAFAHRLDGCAGAALLGGRFAAEPDHG